MDRTGIGAGEEWPEILTNAINACAGVVVLISRDSVHSDYCVKEILYALKKRKPIIAIHLDAARLPDKLDFMLGDVQRVFLADYADFREAVQVVSEGVGKMDVERKSRPAVSQSEMPPA